MSYHYFQLINATLKKYQLLFQLTIFIGIFIISSFLAFSFHLPLPANITGMVIMFLLITLKIIPLKIVKLGSKWLLANMLLFFIPAVVALVNYGDLLLSSGWKILLSLIISTILTFSLTSLIVDQVYRFELKTYLRNKHKHKIKGS